jgi:hypothetical protein
MIDWRGFAGQKVIVGLSERDYEARGIDLQHCYVLGLLEDGSDLPETVKAIIGDEAQEASELLWVVHVADDGTRGQVLPLVVFDDQERLRFGQEIVAAVRDTGITTTVCVIRGVRFD